MIYQRTGDLTARGAPRSFFCIYIVLIFFIFYLIDILGVSSQDCLCKNNKIEYPKTIQEIQEVIKSANENNKKIRIMGSSHSCHELLCTEGYIINTDNFNKILEINNELKRVKVECGIKLRHLFDLLAIENLALPNQGFIAEQTIAGAIATGTHGSGHTGCLSDFVVGMEIIDGLGNLHTISLNANADWLPFLRVNLGAFGFIYSITLQCEQLFLLSHKRELSNWHDVLKNYRNFYDNYDYYMFMAHPIEDLIVNFFWKKTSMPDFDKLKKRSFFSQLSEDIAMNRMLNKFLSKALSYVPQIGKTGMKLWLRSLKCPEHTTYSYLTLSPLKYPLSVDYYYEEEIAIPFEFFQEAISKLRDLYKQYLKRNLLLISLITCRFMPAQFLSCLSPSYGRDTVYINVNIVNKDEHCLYFLHDFENLMLPYQGRPHWAKENFLTKEKVISLYGANATKFNELRNLFDPKHLFSNKFIEKCFE